MGNEISTVGGAVATAATATASAVTFGQVDCVNKATEACANYTGRKAQETLVWNATKTVAAGTAGTVIGAVALVTDNDKLKDAAKEAFEDCGDAAVKLSKGAVATGNGLLNGIPVVGHIKGGIHDLCGDDEGARQAYFSANRTTGVVGGAIAGSLAGPVGAVGGAIAGGAAMDGVHTGYASAKEGEYKPQGQIAAWTQVVKAKNSEEVVGGLVDGIIAPVLDGCTGLTVYKAGGAKLEGKRLEAKANQLLDKAENARGIAPDGQVLKMYDAAKEMNSKAMKLQGKVVVAENLKGGPVEQVVVKGEVNMMGQAVPKTCNKENEDKEEKHKKKEVVLKVFYVNARSINNSRANMDKVRYVRQKISSARPDIVAIVETWLTSSKLDQNIKLSLGLEGYTLFRKDRIDKDAIGRVRRGGGMILAISNTVDAHLVDSYKDQFMKAEINHMFNCSQCAGTTQKNYSFGLLYRRKQPYRHDQTRAEFDEDSRRLWNGHIAGFLSSALQGSGTVLVGDFNFDITVEIPEVDDLPWGMPRSTAGRMAAGIPIYQGFKKFLCSSFERGLFETIENAGMNQHIEDATHTDGGILDLIFSTPGFVRDVRNRGNIGINSVRQDHCILIFELLLGYDCDKK